MKLFPDSPKLSTHNRITKNHNRILYSIYKIFRPSTGNHYTFIYISSQLNLWYQVKYE